MTKRLQVLLNYQEYGEIEAFARGNRMTVAEWVRTGTAQSKRRPDRKLSEGKPSHLLDSGNISRLYYRHDKATSSLAG